MSHFTVLVVTKTNDEDELEAALQKFHEFECTGTSDQYVKDVDITDEIRELMARPAGPDGDKPYNLHDALDYHGLADKTLEHESLVDRGGKHKFGFAIVKDGELVKAVNRTNPDRQWDWWVVGGRYAGRLFANGKQCDQAKKGDLNFDQMQKDKVAERLGYVMAAYKEVLLPAGSNNEDVTKLCAEYVELFAKLDAEWEASEKSGRLYDFLGKDERFAEFRRLKIATIYDDLFGAGVPTTEADPIAWCATAPAITSFAFLGLDGVWRERGDMGWWGMVHDEKDQSAWDEEFNKALAAVPDDHWVTMVDCHI